MKTLVRGSRELSLISALLILTTCSGQFEYDLGTKKQDTQSVLRKSFDATVWDIAGELVFPLIEDHDTRYSSGYDEQIFRSLTVGLEQAEVARVLGKPLSTKEFPDGRRCWYYSQPGSEYRSYFIRALCFSSAGSLRARYRSFYLDW